MHTIAERRLLMLRPDDIAIPNTKQNRKFDEYELKRLADCISANGLVEPIAVRRQQGKYELIAGERRLLAARLAALRRVPCVVHKVNDINADFYAVIENLQRTAPNVFEEAERIQLLIEQYSLTHTETAIRLGIAQSTLSSRLSLLQLEPALRNRITSAGLTVRHTRALLKLPPEKRSEALDEILANGLTALQADELVEKMLHPPVAAAEPAEPIRKMAIGDARLFANSLNKLVDKARSAGLKAQTRRNETEKYIEYKVRIQKECRADNCQLHIC